MLTIEEIDRCERRLTHCTCHVAFKSRNMTDPDCAGCDLGDDVIETFRELRRVWLAVDSAPEGAITADPRANDRASFQYFNGRGEVEAPSVVRLVPLATR